MSHMHLGRFSLTHLEQRCSRRTDTTYLTSCARDALIRRAMDRLLQNEQYLLDQRVIMRVSRLL